MADEIRIDKWLWAARVFKTRNMAADACHRGRISMHGTTLKPSRTVKTGDVVQVRKAPIVWSFKVLKATGNRVGAKMVPEVLENVTPPDQLEILERFKLNGFIDRARGTGRPTKKDRRDLDEFSDTDDDGFEFDFSTEGT
jgi:ribosome-associated heat shock protein Hsp15